MKNLEIETLKFEEKDCMPFRIYFKSYEARQNLEVTYQIVTTFIGMGVFAYGLGMLLEKIL